MKGSLKDTLEDEEIAYVLKENRRLLKEIKKISVVVIEVRGGIATVAHAPKGIKVNIIDHDIINIAKVLKEQGRA